MQKIMRIFLILTTCCITAAWQWPNWSSYSFHHRSSHFLIPLQPKPLLASQMVTSQFYDLPPFVAIASFENMQVDIDADRPYQSVQATGPVNALSCFRPQVIKGVLYLNLKATHAAQKNCASLHVSIKMGPLYSITKLGDGDFNISHVSSPNFDLTAAGSGNLILSGVFHLSTLNYYGSGNLEIYWIDSPQLSVIASGEGSILLAGVTGILHTELTGLTHLDARFLRADTGFIATWDGSEADVWVRDNLYTMADNISDIYFFKKPQFIFRDTRHSGAVLDMHDIPGALLFFQPFSIDT